MIYHPIMGIAFFFVFLIIAFLIGKNSNVIKEKKNNIFYLRKEKNKYSDSICPDASWLK